ncbi:MAG: LPS export ABC transporter permease LptG [Pseudomonadota bacterium]
MPGFRLLHRYIAARFLSAILAVFTICTVLIFIIDFVEMLRQSSKFGAVPFSTLLALTLLRLPAYTEILLGFAVLAGSIAAMLQLSRKSELAVMRAAGMSVWQFTWPGLVVVLALGAFAITVYNPLAAHARASAEAMFAQIYGRESNLLRQKGANGWLRQDGRDGPSVIHALAAKDKGRALNGVTIFQYDRKHRFIARIDGASATLQQGHWLVRDAWVSRLGAPPVRQATYQVSTFLTPEKVADALGSVLSLSFWDLPDLIAVTKRAGLKPIRYQIQYELLLARPFLLVVMVLLAATVSLRSFRGGGIQTMVIFGMVGGLGFFLLIEVSRQIGTAGLVPPRLAVWSPIIAALLLSLTVLLHQEDG